MYRPIPEASKSDHRPGTLKRASDSFQLWRIGITVVGLPQQIDAQSPTKTTTVKGEKQGRRTTLQIVELSRDCGVDVSRTTDIDVEMETIRCREAAALNVTSELTDDYAEQHGYPPQKEYFILDDDTSTMSLSQAAGYLRQAARIVRHAENALYAREHGELLIPNMYP